MKKIGLFVVAAVAFSVLPACFSTNTSDISNLAPTTTQPAVFKPVYQVDKTTVKADATVHSILCWINWGVTKEADMTNLGGCVGGFIQLPTAAALAKAGATYNACAASGKEAIVGGNYIIETKDYFVYKQVKATVIGYPAKLTGVEEVKVTPTTSVLPIK